MLNWVFEYNNKNLHHFLRNFLIFFLCFMFLVQLKRAIIFMFCCGIWVFFCVMSVKKCFPTTHHKLYLLTANKDFYMKKEKEGITRDEKRVEWEQEKSIPKKRRFVFFLMNSKVLTNFSWTLRGGKVNINQHCFFFFGSTTKSRANEFFVFFNSNYC